MIEVIHYQNESVETPLEDKISKYYDEVRKLLPKLPETIQVYFGDYGIMPEFGLGGYAYSKDIITISIDPNFADKKKQLANIRPTIFHEAFRVYQDFTGQSKQYPAIEGAIYEGMATVFERDYADTLEPYGDYSQLDATKLAEWAKSLENIDDEKYKDEEVYRAWKFYHPEIKEKWISYRVGAWITDQVLSSKNIGILDLADMRASKVYQLFNESLSTK